MRLQHPGPPVHSVSVPLHDALKAGTIHSILADVAVMRGVRLDWMGGWLARGSILWGGVVGCAVTAMSGFAGS